MLSLKGPGTSSSAGVAARPHEVISLAVLCRAAYETEVSRSGLGAGDVGLNSYCSLVTDQPDDTLAKIFETISSKDAEHRNAFDESEANFSRVIAWCIDRWHEWWHQSSAVFSPLEVKAKLDHKFQVCFPLSAHALNHVEAAWNARMSFPWVAKSGARIAFEHALTAQWVLLTERGELELKSQLDRYAYVRREKYVGSVRSLSQSDESFAQAAHGLTDAELAALVGERPERGRRSFEEVCRRFSSKDTADLLYDVSRDLSEAVHPSYGLIQSYLTFDPSWAPRGVDWRGANGNAGELIRASAVSGLWALYALEVCRKGQPNAAAVAEIGHHAGLPVDLRSSDRQPDRQPVSDRYWQ